MVRTTRPNQKRGEIPNKDTFTRINFMYQATHLALQQNPGNTEIIRFYCHSVKSIAKKQVLRLHPHIKRHICKKCAMLLVPGVTATVRKKGKKQRHIVVKCMECETPKRFPVNAKYKLWGEQHSAWFSMHPEGAPLPTEDGPSPGIDGVSTSSTTSMKKCSHKRCRSRPKCRKITGPEVEDAEPESEPLVPEVLALRGDRTKECLKSALNDSEPMDLAHVCSESIPSNGQSDTLNGSPKCDPKKCDRTRNVLDLMQSDLGKEKDSRTDVEASIVENDLGTASNKCNHRNNKSEYVESALKRSSINNNHKERTVKKLKLDGSFDDLVC